MHATLHSGSSILEFLLPIEAVHSFLVHPKKGLDPTSARGTKVRHEGQLFALLQRVFSRAPNECEIDIYFTPDENGNQNNPCRDEFISYMEDQSMPAARAIAQRLADATDRRSALGLLFITYGRQGRLHQFLVSRFPTDEGILADESEGSLSVQYLERVFMKNKHSYKAVYYEDSSLRNGMWTGRAVDRQNTDQGVSFSSNYWITDFLRSEMSLTPAAGTRRFGVALKEALKKDQPPAVKRELVAAATLATGLRQQSVSIASLSDRFNLSEQARSAITAELKSPNAALQRFRFDETEFRAVVGLLSVELNNGGILTAPSADFNKIFARRDLADSEEVEFRTRGLIVAERLNKRSA